LKLKICQILNQLKMSLMLMINENYSMKWTMGLILVPTRQQNSLVSVRLGEFIAHTKVHRQSLSKLVCLIMISLLKISTLTAKLQWWNYHKVKMLLSTLKVGLLLLVSIIMTILSWINIPLHCTIKSQKNILHITNYPLMPSSSVSYKSQERFQEYTKSELFTETSNQTIFSLITMIQMT
jgi:hypothetical protein